MGPAVADTGDVSALRVLLFKVRTQASTAKDDDSYQFGSREWEVRSGVRGATTRDWTTSHCSTDVYRFAATRRAK